MMYIYEDVRINHQHRRLLRHAAPLPPRRNVGVICPGVHRHAPGLLSAQTKRALPVALVALALLREVDHQVLEDAVLGV